MLASLFMLTLSAKPARMRCHAGSSMPTPTQFSARALEFHRNLFGAVPSSPDTPESSCELSKALWRPSRAQCKLPGRPPEHS
eukprot:2922629-Alexandrium_andersonii.AAC.1